MNIILFLLKLILLILLVLLGVLLGILLFALFCAIRYRIDGSYRKGLNAQVKVRLFWVLSLQVTLKDGKQNIRIRLFGKGLNEKKPSSKKPPSPPSVSGGEQGAPAAEALPEPPKPSLQTSPKPEERERKERQKQNSAPKMQAAPSVFRRIQSFVQNFVRKLKFAFQSFCDKIKQTKNRIQWLREKWEMAADFIQDPENVKSAGLILRQGKKLLVHLLPRKGSGEVMFGLEDPYLMGKALSAAGVLYPFTQDKICIQPIFGQNCLEGELHLTGKIRPGVMMIYGLRLLIDRNIRRKLMAFLRRKKDEG